MKILYIDPWCANKSNLYYYSTGLAGAIAEESDLTMICQANCDLPSEIDYTVYKLFFPRSFSMKRGIIRTFVRGLEYILSYKSIEKLCKNEKYDVIHIEWLLLYNYDISELKRLKKHCKLLVLKAHNILPHSSGDKFLSAFKQIYDIPDIILLHGDKLKEEFASIFPQYVDKVRIQKHGLYMNHDKSCATNNIDKKVRTIIESYNRIYLFCGRIDYDKGVDRLIEGWKADFRDKHSLLIIAGKVNDGYAFDKYESMLHECNNILRVEGFVEDNLLNYLISKSNLIILPYRDGSMSGVAFTAAEFSKPLLTTTFGAIEEYIVDQENGFVVNNDDTSIVAMLKHIDDNVSNEMLEDMGTKLNQYFAANYSWSNIGKKLVEEVFNPLLFLRR